MTGQQKAEKIIRDLAKNASLIKGRVREGNLAESIRLTAERVALVEALRELMEAKVSLGSSERKDEMFNVLRSIQNDVSEATSSIRTRLSTLMKDLAKMKGAREIAAYKIQGGRYGY